MPRNLSCRRLEVLSERRTLPVLRAYKTPQIRHNQGHDNEARSSTLGKGLQS